MSVYEKAKQMELDGRAHYLHMMEAAQDSSLKAILKLLAEEELKHHAIITAMQAGEAHFETLGGQNDTESYFNHILEKGMDIQANMTAVEGYKKAVLFEKASVDFYRLEAGKTKNPSDRVTLLKLHYEEKKHQLMLENIIEFIMDPQIHIANPEFDALDPKDFE